MRSAFTLIELLLVIALIGILAGLFLGAVQKTRQAASRLACQNQLKQIGLAMQAFHEAHQRFPPGWLSPDPTGLQIPNRLGVPFTGWRVNLLPYLGESSLYNQILAQPLDFPKGLPDYFAISTKVNAYLCPADPKSGTVGPNASFGIEVAFSNYLGVSGINRTTRDGVLFVESQIRMADILDGTSNTLMIGERPPSVDRDFGNWYTTFWFKDAAHDLVSGVMEFNPPWYREFLPGLCPTNVAYPFQAPKNFDEPCAYLHYWSYHPSGANFLFADGSVKLFPYSSALMLPGISTRNGGEITPE